MSFEGTQGCPRRLTGEPTSHPGQVHRYFRTEGNDGERVCDRINGPAAPLIDPIRFPGNYKKTPSQMILWPVRLHMDGNHDETGGFSDNHGLSTTPLAGMPVMEERNG